MVDDVQDKDRILIVDDSPVNIQMLAAVLMSNYELSVTTNGAEALDIAGSGFPPDLILLDITMPEMDGYEVCRRLKSEPQTMNIPVIFITARTEESEEAEGFAVGAVDYITKPFSPAIVKARVNTHLELKRHRDRLLKLNDRLIEEVAERKRSENALKHLLKKQEIHIDLAKSLLKLVNGLPPRYIPISDQLDLFVRVISVPCYAEGGDHHFIRNLNTGRKCTAVSLKDQSGHEVSCVLKSIITDLMHHALLNRRDGMGLEKIITDLNNEICNSNIFKSDDFITAICAELDHETLQFRYVSAGHPPMLLIRDDQIILLPGPKKKGMNLPLAVFGKHIFEAGEFTLQPGDRLLGYTDGLNEMPQKNIQRTINQDELIEIVKDILKSDLHMPISQIMDTLLVQVATLSHEQVSSDGTNTSADDVSIIGLELEHTGNCIEDVWKIQNVDDICAKIAELNKTLCYEWNLYGYQHAKSRVGMVTEDVLLNAWIHGNQRDPNKTITVRRRYGNDFHLEVIDEGSGFDYWKIPDPTNHWNLMKDSGRGIFITRHFSDDVNWKSGGRHICIRFSKNPDNTNWNQQIPIWMNLSKYF